MTALFRHGFKLTAGFDVLKHQRLSLLSLGVPLSAVPAAKALLKANGWEFLADYHSTLLHNETVYDWVNIEAIAPASAELIFSKINLLASALKFSPAIPVHNLTVVNFWNKLSSGTVSHLYYDGNKNYWIPVDGALPFGITSNEPVAYTFIGLTNPLNHARFPAVIVHTAPATPILDTLFCQVDLAKRTAGVVYLSPVDNDKWFFAITGESLIGLASQTEDLAGWTVPDYDVQYLLSQSKKYQFTVALVARRWRKEYEAISADIFTSIIRDPYTMAGRLNYGPNELNNTIARFFE